MAVFSILELEKNDPNFQAILSWNIFSDLSKNFFPGKFLPEAD